MTQLHELLAVEDSLNTVFTAAQKEAATTFGGKDHLFKGHHIEETPLYEDSEGAQLDPLVETSEVAETVYGKLSFVFGHLTKALNVYAQKELANQSAKADLVVNGEVIVKDCPATLLLGLETRLRGVRDMCSKVKTFDQSKDWSATSRKHVLKCAPEHEH